MLQKAYKQRRTGRMKKINKERNVCQEDKRESNLFKIK